MTLFRVYGQDELGSDGYPPIWHQTLKHEVRSAAGDRCVRCKHPYKRGEHGNGQWSACDEQCLHGEPYRWVDDFAEGDWQTTDGLFDPPLAGQTAELVDRVEAEWRILTVHHLDGDKANCRWWNLAALCQRCHLEIQGRVRMERTYLLEHSNWFKPYVAGFYAWRYLQQDLSCAEVEARLDELLALEHQQLELVPALPDAGDSPTESAEAVPSTKGTGSFACSPSPLHS